MAAVQPAQAGRPRRHVNIGWPATPPARAKGVASMATTRKGGAAASRSQGGTGTARQRGAGSRADDSPLADVVQRAGEVAGTVREGIAQAGQAGGDVAATTGRKVKKTAAAAGQTMSEAAAAAGQ